MGWIAWSLISTTLILGIILIIVVMMQKSKDSKSVITGGNTFYGSNKNNTLDGLLAKMTIVVGLLFITSCFLTSVAIIK